MTANTRLLAIRADSFVHVGEGQGFGEVDRKSVV